MKTLVFLFGLLLTGIVCSAQTKIYFTDTGTNDIRCADLDGQNVEILLSGINTARGICVDENSNKLYYADGDNNIIGVIDLETLDTSVLLTGLAEPIDLYLDKTNGIIYFSDNALGCIMKVNTDGTGLENLMCNLPNLHGITVDPDGNKLYWCDWSLNAIQQSNLDGSNVQTIIGNVNNLHRLALDCNGKVNWTDSGENQVRKANLDGTSQENLASCIGGNGIAYVSSTEEIFWVNELAGTLWKFDSNGSNETEIYSDGISPSGLYISYCENTTSIPFISNHEITVRTNNANGQLLIEGIHLNSDFEVSIFDESGRLLHHKAACASQQIVSISIDSLHNGYYAVHISAGEQTTTQKVILMREGLRNQDHNSISLERIIFPKSDPEVPLPNTYCLLNFIRTNSRKELNPEFLVLNQCS
ncbi:MAG: T9SS type A sorting domain-containing protein [Flavobacteriales bacterium]|mgnify:CR=1 FL=1|nr:T9SS type A sorting domain-containing protein [Flavobacteriales bacterium]